MKKEIHPTYFPEAQVVCSSCGNRFTLGSTKPEIHVEVCNNCHPFYTGEAKFIDTEGRVERFQRRATSKQEPKLKKTPEKKETERPQSLKEMLQFIEKG
ncbi:MAG: 50S ribosomal protein L31 [Candidatus Woykebacteria bacterium]